MAMLNPKTGLMEEPVTSLGVPRVLQRGPGAVNFAGQPSAVHHIPLGPTLALEVFSLLRRAETLVVVFSEGRPQQNADPHFQFAAWARSQKDTAFLIVADPAPPPQEAYTSSWWIGLPEADPIALLEPVVRRALGKCGADRVIVSGRRSGGFAALRALASWDLPVTAVVENPPLSLLDVPRQNHFARLVNQTWGTAHLPTAARVHPERFDAVVALAANNPVGELHVIAPITEPLDAYRALKQALGVTSATGWDITGKKRFALYDPDELSDPATSTTIALLDELLRLLAPRPTIEPGDPHTAPQPDIAAEVAQLRSQLNEVIVLQRRTFDQVAARAKALEAQLIQLPQQTGDYARLRSLLVPDAAPLPAAGGWALDTAPLGSIARRILSTPEPLGVVELGSGVSTLWILLAQQQADRGWCTSFEHLPEFAEKTMSGLVGAGVADRADIRTVPLVEHIADGQLTRFYDVDSVNLVGDIDILLVDGPPTASGPLARFAALRSFQAHLNAGAWIVVDDLDRADEQQMVQRWQEQGARLVLLEKFPRTAIYRFDGFNEALPAAPVDDAAQH